MRPRSDLMHPGVYEIVHEPTNRRYIGSTKNVSKRLFEHYNALLRGDHPTPRLQNSWNKHGEEQFCFSLIESCLDEPAILFAREQFWIDKNKKRLFNARPFAEPMGVEWRQSEQAHAVFQQHGRAMKEWWKKRKPIGKTCEVCRNAYETRSTNRKARFCSWKCSRSVRPVSPKSIVTQTCPKCGREFRGIRGRIGSHCSLKCSNRQRSPIEPSDVVAIIARAVHGEQFSLIARDYQIGSVQVARILWRKRWGDVVLPDDLEQKRQDFLSGDNRVPRGSKAKLGRQDVFDILDSIQKGEPQNQIAKRYGLSQASVSDIKTGRSKIYRNYVCEYFEKRLTA